jgi:DNA-binding ferritin-like protein
MEIQIVKIQSNTECALDSTRLFGLALNKALIKIKMIHWYVLDYNVHRIIGKLYEELNNLIDQLQEEIIGSVRILNKVFPQINCNLFVIDEINEYTPRDSDMISIYYDTVNNLSNVLCSQEFVNYANSGTIGLNNTKDEILTAINKTNYLLSLCTKP